MKDPSLQCFQYFIRITPKLRKTILKLLNKMENKIKRTVFQVTILTTGEMTGSASKKLAFLTYTWLILSKGPI